MLWINLPHDTILKIGDKDLKLCSSMYFFWLKLLRCTVGKKWWMLVMSLLMNRLTVLLVMRLFARRGSQSTSLSGRKAHQERSKCTHRSWSPLGDVHMNIHVNLMLCLIDMRKMTWLLEISHLESRWVRLHPCSKKNGISFNNCFDFIYWCHLIFQV